MAISTLKTILLLTATLTAGTISTVLTKLLYETHCIWSIKDVKKPYFAALLMFIGEMLCLLLFKLTTTTSVKRSNPHNFPAASISATDEYHNVNSSGSGKTSPFLPPAPSNKDFLVNEYVSDENDGMQARAKIRPPWYYFLGFCSFDLTATVISGIGLLWVDASLYQMLRGGTVVFAAIVSKIVLKKKFTWIQIGGLVGVVLGLCVVGLSGALKNHFDTHSKDASSTSTSTQTLVGIILIVVSSMLQGTQSVFEEKYMKQSEIYAVEPLELVGWEGVFGTMLCVFILLPVAQLVDGSDSGHAEDTLHTLKTLGSEWRVSLIMFFYTLNIACFNYLSNTVSKLLSAVHRQLINASRTVSIWAVELVFFYKVKTCLGEEWSDWSFMQLGGFVLLLAGTFTYGLTKPFAAK